MKGKPDDKQRLEHILEAIERIKKFTKDLKFEDFEENEMAQFAVIKNFEIIGEAAYHVSDELRTKNQEVEWKRISGLRHVLVHDYYKVNLSIIWNAKERRIGELKRQVEAILKSMNT
jgi:uncharacterized protein with HEPN domain